MSQLYVSKANRALCVPRTEGMMRLFPEGKALPDTNYWVIKHDLPSVHILRKLGLRAPNPALCYYNWAGGSPFDVQQFTVDLLTGNPRAYVLNDMGTGKTRAALWAWDYLRSNNYAGKLLVACKLSNIERTWGNEAFATIPHRKVALLHGSKKKRIARLNDPDAEIFVVNHDGIKVIWDELIKHPEIDVLCLDEMAAFRNPNARSKLVAKLAARMKFVWGMTGSPMPNEPTDVWMQCQIITPHTVPRYKTHARDQLMVKSTFNEFKWDPKPDAIERAYSWMQPAVRFKLDDVTELPEINYRDVAVSETAIQRKLYNTVRDYFVAQLNNQKISAANAAAVMSKLLQVAGGYVYSDTGVAEVDVAPRVDALLDIIESAPAKVIVFFPFRHMVEGVAKILSERVVDDPKLFEAAIVHGDVSPGARNQIFGDFQDTPKYKVLLAHPGCMAHGLTLTAADTIVWWCPITSYELYEQANARIRRVGQHHKQQIFHLQTMPVERKLYKMLQNHEKLQETFLQLFEEATAKETGS